MRILVAMDGSRGAAAALKFASRLAARDEASQLIILTIGRSTRVSSLRKPVAELDSAVEKELEERAARKILEDAARKLQRTGLESRVRYVTASRRPAVPEAISREADRLRADLVVVGSEGRDTLSEWVVGGVALRLIYVARRPVTVVRPPRRRRLS